MLVFGDSDDLPAFAGGLFADSVGASFSALFAARERLAKVERRESRSFGGPLVPVYAANVASLLEGRIV